ncbi:MAG: cupredoxin domain-containing protein [Thermoplasmata archaeon]
MNSAHQGSRSALLLLVLASLALVSAVPGITAAHTSIESASPSAGVNNVAVMATGSLSFVPDQLSVSPGALVHLVVTQEANFEHTFTLSSVANFTIPSGDSSAQLAAFFNAHPPIVNLSLGSTPGAEFFANFTAPAAGSYEFVCLIHFADGMTGEMVSGASSSSSSPSTFPLTSVVIGVIIVAVVVVVAAVVVVTRRRKKGPTPETPPDMNAPK